jgi:hypothetical protein
VTERDEYGSESDRARRKHVPIGPFPKYARADTPCECAWRDLKVREKVLNWLLGRPQETVLILFVPDRFGATHGRRAAIFRRKVATEGGRRITTAIDSITGMVLLAREVKR